MCNEACIAFAHRVLGVDEVAGRRVLEVGSYDTTGTVRPGLEALGPATYVGVDIASGPSVDVICDVADLVFRFGIEAFDVVISTEMVEHVRDWRRAFINMKSVLAPGGILVVTTRSLGFPYHFGPLDWWRYEAEDMRAIAADMEILALESDPLSPGVFLAARKGAAAPTDLAPIALHSMVLDRRARDVGDGDVRRFEWTHPRVLARRLPSPVVAAAKVGYRLARAATNRSPG